MKYLTVILFVSFFSVITAVPSKTQANSEEKKHQQDNIKKKAFSVLQNKCNTCHATKRRLYIFTWDNMDSLRNEINNQVFITNKMPKGKKNQLTEDEELQLESWIGSLN